MSETGKRGTNPLGAKDSAPVPPHESKVQAQERAPVRVHSDQFYRTMVEQSLGLICAHDFAGNLLYVNPAAIQALGYSPEAWVGKNLRSFLAPSFQPFFDVYLQRIRQHRSDEGFMRVVTATGESRLWRYHNSWYEEDGHPLYVIGCAQDVTEAVRLQRALRKAHDELEQRVQERTAELAQTNAALQQSEERYRGLFENANDIIATLTMDGIITSVNRAAEAFLGWPRGELVGKHLRTVNTPASVARIEDRTRRLLAGEKLTSNLEVEVIRKDGSIVLLECRTRPMYDKDGKLTEVQGIFRDITARKRVEESLRDAKEAAEQADRAKSDFLSILNHELRTPLSVILGYVDLFLEGTFGAPNEEQRGILHRLHANACSVLDLVSDGLNLSRLDAGRLAVEFTDVKIPALFKAIETETYTMRELSGLRFTWLVGSDLPSLSSDPGKLKVVIKNLLSNAIKFTRAGEITVGVQSYDSWVEIYVTDTGIGIPFDQQAVIFDAFRQGSMANVRGLTGVGLGLHIVKRLLGLLGGTISVESEVGKGSTFRVRLPQQPPRTT
jgi:PAS domain S-box-containing protein